MTAPPMTGPGEDGWKIIPAEAFYRRIGPLYARRDGDRWEYGLQTTAEHDNGTGAVHGGVLATFADHALSILAWAAAGQRPAATISLQLHYAGAVRPGQFVVARGHLIRAGATLVYLTGTLHAGTSEVASITGIWSVRPKPAGP